MQRIASFSAQVTSHPGKVRSRNEDNYLLEEQRGLFAVADGMGGHRAGHMASKICLEELAKESLEPPQEELGCWLQGCLARAGYKVHARSLEELALEGMGTTATALFLRKDRGYWAHVGDSRLYLLRKKRLYQLSKDHTLAQLQKDLAGSIHSQLGQSLSHALTRSLGYRAQEKVDRGELQLLPGDSFLLCSDGLHNKVQDREIQDQLSQEGPELTQKLIDLANARGGEDNITALWVKVLDN